MGERRPRGEGAVYQRHDHPGCPPPDADGHRPRHRCQGRWVAVVDLGWSAGRRNRRTFYGRTQKEVRIKLATALAERSHGTLLARAPTVEEWLTYWLDVVCVERGLKVNTLKSHRSKVTRYLIPNLGRHRLDRLAPEHVRAMYARMRTDGLSEGTLRGTHAVLGRALTVAVRERKISHNVASMLDPPGTRKEKRRPLALADAQRILTERDELRWWVALFLGIRQGEALALRWSDVDLDAGTLEITRSLIRVPGQGLRFDTPKSANSVRLLPLPRVALARFKLAHALDEPDADALIFHRGGQPLDHRADWQAWRDMLDDLGIERATLHAARNTAASLLESAGVPARVVMQILGQGSLAVTYGYQYSELEPMRKALGSLGQLLELGGDFVQGGDDLVGEVVTDQ